MFNLNYQSRLTFLRHDYDQNNQIIDTTTMKDVFILIDASGNLRLFVWAEMLEDKNPHKMVKAMSANESGLFHPPTIANVSYATTKGTYTFNLLCEYDPETNLFNGYTIEMNDNEKLFLNVEA